MLYFNASSGETVLSGLTNENSDMLMRSIFQIDKNTTRLDLGWNNFDKRPNCELQRALSHLNNQIKFVTLRGNSLGKKSGEDAVLVFSSLKYATHVDLSFNDLNLQNRLDIGLKSFASTQVTSLDLSSNHLGFNDNKQLNKAVTGLTGLKSLKMSYNKLDKKSEEELEALCSAFPINLEHLDISNNNLGSKINAIRKLPKTIASLNISDNDIAQLAIEDIHNLNDSLTHLQTLYISIDEFHKMSSKQQKAWKPILSAINKVVFLDSAEKEVIPELSLFSINRSVFFSRNCEKKEHDIVEPLKNFAKSIADNLR
ncbi:MAG: hypothetical protein LEGION0403_FIIPPAGN_01699 [Legionella sp.]|uniref:hypothetical protein n=1 Tax=Legionella sp. TaxID=459 RepID=UPI003D11E64C